MNTQIEFYKYQLVRLNSNPKYGYNWISNLENMRSNEKIKLYPTGYNSSTTGRVYIALPADKILSKEDIITYNILK
jgi:ActR/RegA family two-component response regulator